MKKLTGISRLSLALRGWSSKQKQATFTKYLPAFSGVTLKVEWPRVERLPVFCAK